MFNLGLNFALQTIQKRTSCRAIVASPILHRQPVTGVDDLTDWMRFDSWDPARDQQPWRKILGPTAPSAAV
jgi:hypothetical protein